MGRRFFNGGYSILYPSLHRYVLMVMVVLLVVMTVHVVMMVALLELR